MERSKMKYCKDTTCKHELAQMYPHCLQEISSYMKKEGGKGNLFVKQELCINIDEVERKNPNANKEATMDMSIGVNFDNYKHYMLLVELRFNYKSPKNISETNIRNKITHSKELVKGTIVPNYIFLFPKQCKNEARAHFNRIFKGKKVSCTIMDEEEFYNHYFE